MKWYWWGLWIGLGLIVLAFLYVGGMILYATLHDYDPPLLEKPALSGTASADSLPDTLNIFNWNIGYAGLGKESDFFYDGGTKVHMPQTLVHKNLNGILKEIEMQLPATDFFLLQEVDQHSSRSYYVGMQDEISQTLPGFVSGFGLNYQVDFIPIPFTEPMGQVQSGVATWSRYTPSEIIRYAFEGNYDWPTYLFFLDRCYLLMRFPLAGGQDLVLINTHNSAYDDGSLKKRQMEQMRAVLLQEYEKGNYVIVGGDWNQFPPGYQGIAGFPLKEQGTGLRVAAEYPAPDWQWAYDPDHATNRSLVAPFDPDTTARFIIDYYLLSPNVELLEVETLDRQFEYSDHQPVRLKAVLRRDS